MGDNETLIDLATATTMATGCGWSLHEFAAFYRQGTRAELDQLEQAIQSGETADVERLAHGARGASASAGVTGMVEIYGHLEDAARGGKTDGFPTLLERAEARFLEVMLAFEAAVEGV